MAPRKWISVFVTCLSLSLLCSCSTSKKSDKAEVSGYVYFLKVSDLVKATDIDVTEDYFLLKLKPGYKSRDGFVSGELMPLAIHHPNGVDVCCVDTT